MKLPDAMGLTEWLLVGVLVLLFVGPERIPGLARWVGRLYGRLARRSAEQGEAAFDGWAVVEAVAIVLIALLLPTWLWLLARR